MFESSACCRLLRAENPAVDCAALLDLKLLLERTRSPGRDFVVQAQHHSSPGGADARIRDSIEHANQIVSPAATNSGLAKATARNQAEDRGTTCATVARTQAKNPNRLSRKGGA